MQNMPIQIIRLEKYPSNLFIFSPLVIMDLLTWYVVICMSYTKDG
jgi:hypothetical protein